MSATIERGLEQVSLIDSEETIEGHFSQMTKGRCKCILDSRVYRSDCSVRAPRRGIYIRLAEVTSISCEW
eukprot:5852495-Amphidinium_carterae.1